MTFDRHNGFIGVSNCLTLCNLTDNSFTGFCKSNDGRSRSCSFGIRDYDGLSALIYGNA